LRDFLPVVAGALDHPLWFAVGIVDPAAQPAIDKAFF